MDYDRVHLVFAAKAFCEPNWKWLNRGTRELFNLWYVADGVGELEQVGRTYSLSEGTCFLLREWIPHAAHHEPRHPLTVPFIQFQMIDDNGQPYIPELSDVLAEHRVLPERTMLAGLMDRCIESWNCGDRESAQHWLISCLRELDRQDTVSIGGGESHQRTVIEKAAKLIEDNPEVHWSINKMAQMAGYSQDHFTRLFKAYRGTTPGNYQVRCRIAEAMNRLRFSEDTISQIADDLGYPDIYCFSRQFRNVMGHPPSHFRN